MTSGRLIRSLALQALYAIDVAEGRDTDAVSAALDAARILGPGDEAPGAEDTPDPTPGQRRRAFDLAREAWDRRAEADEFFVRLAPTWPAARQPVVDRSILRLAWCELSLGSVAPRIIVDEAIELAKAYSTDRSPAFVNAMLDKALRHFESGGQPGGWAPGDTDDTDEAGEPEGLAGPASPRAGPPSFPTLPAPEPSPRPESAAGG